MLSLASLGICWVVDTDAVGRDRHPIPVEDERRLNRRRLRFAVEAAEGIDVHELVKRCVPVHHVDAEAFERSCNLQL